MFATSLMTSEKSEKKQQQKHFTKRACRPIDSFSVIGKTEKCKQSDDTTESNEQLVVVNDLPALVREPSSFSRLKSE